MRYFSGFISVKTSLVIDRLILLSLRRGLSSHYLPPHHRTAAFGHGRIIVVSSLHFIIVRVLLRSIDGQRLSVLNKNIEI
jgi:hypothetical protein